MTGILLNPNVLSKLGECDLSYLGYISYKYIRQKLCQKIQADVRFKRRHFSKFSYLYFRSGNSGNCGNNALNILIFQQSYVTTLGRFCYHCYHFPICRGKLSALFLLDILKIALFIADIFENDYFSICYLLINFYLLCATDVCQNMMLKNVNNVSPPNST